MPLGERFTPILFISARSVQRPPGLISYRRAPRQLRTLSHRGLYTAQPEHRILPLVFGGTVRSLQPFADGILEDDGPADRGGTAPRARVDGCCHQGWGHHSYEERTSRLRLRILSSGRTQTSAEVRSRPDKTILILPCHSQKRSCSLRASKPLSTGPWQATATLEFVPKLVWRHSLDADDLHFPLDICPPNVARISGGPKARHQLTNLTPSRTVIGEPSATKTDVGDPARTGPN